MTKHIHTRTIFYDTDIANKEIPFFRGAVLKNHRCSTKELPETTFFSPIKIDATDSHRPSHIFKCSIIPLHPTR